MMSHELAASIIGPELLGAAHIPNAGPVALSSFKIAKLPSGSAYISVTGSDSPTAKTVLFIHGAGTNGRIWIPLLQTAEIADKFEIVTYDLEGHGLSPWEGGAQGGEFLVEKWARIAGEVLDHVGAKEAYIVGHDVGAYIALTLAGKQPERVQGLLLINPAVATQKDPDLVLAKQVETVLSGKDLTPDPGLSGSAFHQTDTFWNPRTVSTQTSVLLTTILTTCYHTTPPQVVANGITAQIGPEPDYEAAKVVRKVVIEGRDDNVVPKQSTRSLNDAIGSASYWSKLHGVGHYAILEDIGTTSELLRLVLGL